MNNLLKDLNISYLWRILNDWRNRLYKCCVVNLLICNSALVYFVESNIFAENFENVLKK